MRQRGDGSVRLGVRGAFAVLAVHRVPCSLDRLADDEVRAAPGVCGHRLGAAGLRSLLLASYEDGKLVHRGGVGTDLTYKLRRVSAAPIQLRSAPEVPAKRCVFHLEPAAPMPRYGLITFQQWRIQWQCLP